MRLIDGFIDRAKASPARVVFPEGEDERIIQAASRAKADGIAEPILIGNYDCIKKTAQDNAIDLEGVRLCTPDDPDLLERFAESYAATSSVKVGIARKLVKRPLAFGGMMVRENKAEGMVAGVDSATSLVIQSATLTIGLAEGFTTPSSFFVMVIPDFMGEKDKPFIFADSGAVIKPDSGQLAEIAVASGQNAERLLGVVPKVAMLSFSTKGSATHEDVGHVTAALDAARKMAPDMDFDGELQGDSAIVPDVAAKKVGESPVAGQANVLIFPDLNSGNICYKLVQYMAGATALGPILQGFSKPVNDMSRGATVDDIIGVTAITVIQANA